MVETLVMRFGGRSESDWVIMLDFCSGGAARTSLVMWRRRIRSVGLESCMMRSIDFVGCNRS